MHHEQCDWCHGSKLVTLWRKGYEGSVVMVAEEIDTKTGEIEKRRVPGVVAIHCRECPLGEYAYMQFPDEERRKLWTTRHMMAERPNYLQRHYLTTDPTYRAIFQTEEEAIDWMQSLGRGPLGSAMDAIGEDGRAEINRLSRAAAHA